MGILITAALSALHFTTCDLADVVVDDTRLMLEVANDRRSRSKGLMFREELAPYSGMIFVYPEPKPVQFWMKNTPLSLDIIFLAAEGKIVKVHEAAVPFDKTPIVGGENIQYVIELLAGQADDLALVAGDSIQSVSCQGPHFRL